MKELYIGREIESNDIALDDARISRKHHCKCVLRDDGTITITDFGSTNGVVVDGVRITEETLVEETSAVRIGGMELSGTEIRKWFDAKENDALAKCEKIKRKYEDLTKRYHNNLNELLKAVEVDKNPISVWMAGESILLFR